MHTSAFICISIFRLFLSIFILILRFLLALHIILGSLFALARFLLFVFCTAFAFAFAQLFAQFAFH